jgi:hypothetical protein
MTDNWSPFFAATILTDAEKDYVFGFQFHHSGSFMTQLYELIHLADSENTEKLRKGFPDEVASVLAWTQGDLADRVQTLGISP